MKPRADEELFDQKKYLEDSCKPKCVKPLIEYEACMKRIEGDDSGEKHCTGQYFDYLFCVDKCHPLNFSFCNAGCTNAILKTQVIGKLFIHLSGFIPMFSWLI
uniref:Complex III subunit VI n=1 Tax=Manihot esculenta TaxID=3983 RepID=A0A2C9U2Q8_MANES